MPAGPYPTKEMHEALKARVTTLEARPTWTREQIEDQVAGMFPGATYNDNGDGTGTIALPAGVTREQVEDWAASLIAAGTNVTINYADNAENPGSLTISAAGTGGSLPAPGTSGNVLTSTGTEWVSAPAPSGVGNGELYPPTLLKITTRPSVPYNTDHRPEWTVHSDPAGAFNPATPSIATVPAGVNRVRITAFIRVTSGPNLVASTLMRNGARSLGLPELVLPATIASHMDVFFASAWAPVTPGDALSVSLYVATSPTTIEGDVNPAFFQIEYR